MGVFFDAWRRAWAAKDLEAIANLVHDDWVITFHSNGKEVRKQQWKSMVASLLKNDVYKQENVRCIFENEDSECDFDHHAILPVHPLATQSDAAYLWALLHPIAVVVMHMFVTFPNGNVDAVMYVATLKDGLMYRSETGSTPVSVVEKDAGNMFDKKVVPKVVPAPASAFWMGAAAVTLMAACVLVARARK